MTETEVASPGHTVLVAPSALEDPTADEALTLVVRVADALRTEGVSYCHWKSNQAMPASLAGENDLDLLVSPADAQRFVHVLARLGFREAVPPGSRTVPGIRSFFGHDEPTGRLVHVHAHLRLMVGDDRTKNWWLRIEEPYVASASRSGVLPTPEPSVELAVFAIRMTLKHATLDAQLTRRGQLTPTELAEAASLETRADPVAARRSAAAELTGIGGELLDRCIAATRHDGSPLARWRTARRLQRALAAAARRPPPADAIVRVSRRVAWAISSRGSDRTARRRPANGGILVAVIGADGAGKSTAVKGLATWLAPAFTVRTVHLGKPPRSWFTVAVRAVSWIRRRVWPSAGFGTTDALRGVAVARDRARALRRAARWAAAGDVVLCDRFPLTAVRSMDGPRRRERGDAHRVDRRLAAFEFACYARAPRPDVLFVLTVPPEVAAARRSGADAALARARAEDIARSDWRGTDAIVVDAARHLDAVHAELRCRLWERL